MHHGEGLRRLLDVAGSSVDGRSNDRNEALVHALSTDYTTADLSEEDRSMLDYAARLTRTPGAIEASDVDALRAHGFDDRAVHDICAITGYYAFVNRIADGLGVELEENRG